MKFTQVATALLGVAAAANKSDMESDDKLSQLITSALAGAPPGIIEEPAKGLTGTEGQKIDTDGKTKNYKFHWQYVCAFTRWTPTNQWLHNQQKNPTTVKFDATTMTLERFGFIGEDKRCYWGMIGVEWVTPLKVTQIKP